MQCLEWLGLIWNFSLNVSGKQIEEMMPSVEFLINKFPLFTTRELARVAGKINSMHPVVGNVSSLTTRQFDQATESRTCWNPLLIFSFTEAVRSELTFWFGNIHKFNVKQLCQDSFPICQCIQTQYYSSFLHRRVELK